MKLLLDTHVWLWLVGAPERLSAPAREAVASAGELHLSPVSAWEALLLGERGRVQMLPSPAAFVHDALRAIGARSVPLSHDIAIASRALEGFQGRDPVDRFLIATCRVHDLTLVTADRMIRAWPGVATLWQRCACAGRESIVAAEPSVRPNPPACGGAGPKATGSSRSCSE